MERSSPTLEQCQIVKLHKIQSIFLQEFTRRKRENFNKPLAKIAKVWYTYSIEYDKIGE